VAFVVISAGTVTHSRLRAVRARWLGLAGAACAVVLLAAGLAAGYWLGLAHSPYAAGSTGLASHELSKPEVRALVERVATLSGRLSQLEGEAAALAQRIGDPVSTEGRAAAGPSRPSGGPLVPVAGAGLASAMSMLPEDRLGIARLERRFDALAHSIAWLGDVAAERSVAQMAFPYRLPVAGSRVSSSYGLRHDPFTGRLARHTGLDIPAAHGTPILASGGGRVVSAGLRGAYGRAVVIDHGGGLATLYGHASKLLVRPGDVVMPNEPIALVGSTGRSTGPHLHFEVLRDGKRVEPSQYLGRVLAPSELSR
jgi:murein DD-endopeptidase MepM/ murein hydrolase activator NlpD